MNEQQTLTKHEQLQAQLADPRPTRVVGVNDGFSALLGARAGFDSLWASGLGICASHGLPDAGVLGMREFLTAAETMDRATPLPVIADCDTGFGDVNSVRRMVASYQAAGIAGVCIEDKQFPKRNSFRPLQKLADPYEFGAMLMAAKGAQRGAGMVLIARVEALVAGASMVDALKRARLYQRCGADAILIHSKADTAEEVLEFAGHWKTESTRVPLLVVPTTYESVTESTLREAGISGVIYANQALRAAQLAMERALQTIRNDGSSRQLKEQLADVDDLFDVIGMADVETADSDFKAAVADLQMIQDDGRAAETTSLESAVPAP